MNMGLNPVNSTLTIAGISSAGMNLPLSRKSMPLYAVWMLSLGVVGFAFMGFAPGKRSARALAICAVLGLGMLASSCAGVSAGPKTTPPPTPVPYSVTVNGTSGSSQFSTTVNMILQ
jgi:hypothetical protein